MKGLQLVTAFLQKCIKHASKQKSTQSKQIDEDMDYQDSDESDSSKKAGEKPKAQKTTNKRERDDHPPLKRPIIFICNDYYSKNLAPLKEIVLPVKVE